MSQPRDGPNSLPNEESATTAPRAVGFLLYIEVNYVTINTMTRKRHRTGFQQKVILNHSSQIEGMKKALQVISKWEEVETVSAGVIRPAKIRGRAFTLRAQRYDESRTMLKCVATRTGMIQEVHIKTAFPDQVREKIQKEWVT